MTALSRLIEERLGLDPASLGERAYAAALQAIGTLDENDSEAWSRAVERLVVPETWFFRGKVFDELATRIVALCERKTVRILCLPCSTGEEPYSLAMALLDAGASRSWEIVGVDVSRTAIAFARRGVFREFSFREMPPQCRQRYFKKCDAGWMLDDQVRELVTFEVGNVLAYDGGRFDVILCRNLLIYLTPTSRQRALDRLFAMLAPDGIIGVGHAEPSALTNRKVVSIGATELFLFSVGRTEETLRRDPTKPAESSSPEGSAVALRSPTIAARAVSGFEDSAQPTKTPPRDSAVATSVGSPRSLVGPTYETVQSLADTGQLAEALAECHRLIAAAPTAEAYALAGLIHQARGDADAAVTSFRKALYLDPTNATAKAMKAGGAR